MTKNNTTFTPDKFHEILHKDIDKPVQDYRRKWISSRKRYVKQHTGAHKVEWAEATISLESKSINVQVYLNFKKNSISDTEYAKLKHLASSGISQYWSRRINVGGNNFMVLVQAHHRVANAIPVDLHVETDPNVYARSMNPSTLGIDASFIYNKNWHISAAKADYDFKLVSAHEFGHSVLMYAGGVILSWGHKGSTGVLSQSTKSSTPGYPKSGAIDLMKYYDWKKNSASLLRRTTDSIAMDIDVKRLIWGANIKWVK